MLVGADAGCGLLIDADIAIIDLAENGISLSVYQSIGPSVVNHKPTYVDRTFITAHVRDIGFVFQRYLSVVMVLNLPPQARSE